MNKKNIEKALKSKINDWLLSINDDYLKEKIKKDVMITGGAIVSLINNEKPNDYDIYFKTKDTVMEVANYYANIWNNKLNKTTKIKVVDTNDLMNDEYHSKFRFPDRIECMIGSDNNTLQEIREEEVCVFNDDKNGIDDDTEQIYDFKEPEVYLENTQEETKTKEKYTPRYFTTNAITLSDGIQIVIRFWGSIDEIHNNFDFVHCKGSYDDQENELNISQETLFAIINKELIYQGSKYPLCSIIRTRKFINRGYTINAGQYVKMALELNELDLKDLKIFKDQLVGVDSAYFSTLINSLSERKMKDNKFELTNNYLFELINKIFG